LEQFEIEKLNHLMKTKAEREDRLEEYQKTFFDHLKKKITNHDVTMKVANGWEKPIKKVLKRAQNEEIT
jgi:hypothetical protein